MENLPRVLGLPLDEARERLRQCGVEPLVRRTGEVGRQQALRRQEREGLVQEGERVVGVRTTRNGIELVAAPTYRRPRR
ncbi:MAG: hypothetical protein QME79_03300 [Bacillota bacterium]|nr:hypothetical protein [Bacillota bacterium]